MDDPRDVGAEEARELAELADRIAAAFPELSKKHKEIAHFVLEQPDLVAYASAHEVGAETDTSAATVVRFCQALGYDGYQQLQEAIRARLSLQRTAVQRFGERLEGDAASQDLLTQVLATDIHNLERTAVVASGERLQEAGAVIRHARQAIIVGSGLAATLVEYLVYGLQVLDVPTRSVTGGEEPLALALSFAQAEDVVIAISLRRHPRYAMKAVEHARSIGAKSIGIASGELSPLLRETDYAFPVVTDGVAHSPSPVAAMSLLNALVAALSLTAPEQTAQSLQQIDTTYKESGLLDE